jgi:hypothetical protein
LLDEALEGINVPKPAVAVVAEALYMALPDTADKTVDHLRLKQAMARLSA